MSKNKILIAAGTFVLAFAGFLQTNANAKKFISATSGYYLRSGVVYTLFKGASTTNMTTFKRVASQTVKVITGASATAVKLFAVNTSGTLSKTIFTKN